MIQAGQEVFRSIVRSFYKGITGVFLSFALDRSDTLDALRGWIKEVKDNGHEEIMFFLVATRADLVDERKVPA
jgi:GTPase SAR1 family protein